MFRYVIRLGSRYYLTGMWCETEAEALARGPAFAADYGPRARFITAYAVPTHRTARNALTVYGP